MNLKTALAALILSAVALPVAAHEGGRGPDGVRGGLTGAERSQLAEERFAAADADGNGQLTRDEILAAAEAAEQLRREERVAQMIERLDADADGMLSLEEMQAADSEGPARMHRRRGGEGHR